MRPVRHLAVLVAFAAALAAAVAVPGPADRPLPPAIAAAETGTVTGKLTFSAPRPRQPIVVYLEGGPQGEKAALPAALVIRQQGATFNPAFAVVVAGQEVVFENDEEKEIDHNVYSLGAEEVDLGIFPPRESRKHVFAKPGEVSLYCSVHKLMDARLFVAPTRAFALMADDGTFTIAGVPAGKHTLRTYQKARRFPEAGLEVNVRAGETAQVAVEMKR